jgi:phosphohistidine phosphatase
MLLLLIRHAQAEERDDHRFPDDSLRPLVAKGRKAQTRMSRRLERARLIPSAILASPWKRAWQTAGILVRETGLPKKARLPCAALAQDPDLNALREAVGPREPREIVALVGHEPWLSELASLLLTGSSTRVAIDFPKSGVLAIETDLLGPASGLLRFFLTPKSS